MNFQLLVRLLPSPALFKWAWGIRSDCPALLRGSMPLPGSRSQAGLAPLCTPYPSSVHSPR